MKLISSCVALLVFIHVAGAWRRRRRRNPPPPTPPRNCVPGSWSGWSGCSHRCGNAGIQTRSRGKSVTECCGGKCTYQFSETRTCNRNACRNGGRPTSGRCNCNAGWTGTCCERDVNECLQRPCQHNCQNVPGSYTCSCNSCYTKVGTRCQLRQCRIGGKCYTYGRVNPGNQCQDCQKGRETAWTNNNALSCSDGKLCTRNDRCVNGACKGTPFTCRSCESCDGNGCQIKPGFCVIDGKCYTNGNIRPGKPCQQCNSNNPKRWTANNNLKCSDNNVKTRNDRCINGDCSGQPYTCLSCQDHYNDACRLKSGYCIIKTNNVDTCYRANTAKPGNPCQVG
ncbi:extracellular matrix A-like [Paramuricea clavata]|uniref:Extracellular matrix A-like n=1 Tax=Paramuricea clavata TaxID=317549 RepID=A0A6S7LMH2_PARCT|nr:extracellular matrix A-like [Paramuricea clavata]